MEMNQWLRKCPVIAILRGITPAEVEGVFGALLASGICIAEIPLNSPEPFEGIRRAAAIFGAKMLIGAGTVMDPAQVAAIQAAGGKLIVTPHADGEIVSEAKQRGMLALPGIGTATEAFAMLRAGADGVKIFPADVTGPRMVSALRAVLPKDTTIVPVGGIDQSNIAIWQNAGVDGYGIGSALYEPGKSMADVGASAADIMTALQTRIIR